MDTHMKGAEPGDASVREAEYAEEAHKGNGKEKPTYASTW